MRTIFLVLFSLICISFGSTIKQEKENVLFVGDSLTCYSGGWQDQFCKKYGWTKSNISQGGKRTSWMLISLTSHFMTKKDYNIVFIYGGCNDAYSHVNLDSSISNFQKMVNLCNQYKIEPIVIVGYDPERVQTTTIYSEEVTKFHRGRYVELQKKMLNLKNCTIIQKDTTVTRKDSDDGIHLKSSGHKKFANWVISQFDEINSKN